MATLRNHLDAVIDLEKVENISTVSIRCLHNPSAWIFLPKNVEFLGSTDGINFTPLGCTTHSIPDQQSDVLIHRFSSELSGEFRYIKVLAKSQSTCPQGHIAEGESCWLFTDEIVVL